jgi:hypothetical protein
MLERTKRPARGAFFILSHVQLTVLAAGFNFTQAEFNL